jgi:hypothetical protein
LDLDHRLAKAERQFRENRLKMTHSPTGSAVFRGKILLSLFTEGTR